MISQRLLGTREIAVFHHTGCGMLTFSTDQLRTIVKDAEPDNTAVAEQVNRIEFLEFGDIEESVKKDVKFLQDNPLVLAETKITGWTYDVTTGKVCVILLSCFIFIYCLTLRWPKLYNNWLFFLIMR